jgi:hypothetical protein
VHLSDLLARPPRPGEVKKEADEDRRAALRDMLAATMGVVAPEAPAPAPKPRPAAEAPVAPAAPRPEPVAAPSRTAEAVSAAVGAIPAAPAPARKPAPRGIPDDELRAILDAEV